MTAPITLNWFAPKLTNILDRDGDYLAVLEPSVPLPAGTQVWLAWKLPAPADPIIWDAEVTPDRVQIYRPKADVGAVLDARPIGCKLHYKYPGWADLTWYKEEGPPRDRT